MIWPTLHPALFWKDRPARGDRGPDQYTQMNDSGYFLMKEVVNRASDKDESFLDLGCNVGRFLNFLARNGFNNLYGVDIGRSAIESMKTVFPLAAENAEVKLQTIQEYLLNAHSDSFDIVYTMGATVELVPATFPLIKEITRVCKKYVIFLISESGHSFPRFWEYEFKKYGFRMVNLHRYSLERDDLPGDSVLMVFKNIKEV